MTGASDKSDRAVVNGAASVSAVPASVPSAWDVRMDEFLAEGEAKRVKFSEPNPLLWRELLATANPPTLTVCKHLESEEADRGCRCGYPGSVWADGEHILFTMGDIRDPEHPEFQAPRIERSAELASAQLIACLFNNADWLIELAAQAIEARRAATGTGAVHESAVGNADAPAPTLTTTPKDQA